jgi:flagellar hook-associated protein FlgK
VDLNAELAQAILYQRSYEAAVRMQYIMDEMLNVLINHTGSSASNSSV